jgi:ribonuclease D
VDEPQLAATVEAFASGTGPVAIDAERASGYRYGQKAYLIQLRRAGSGSALIDPVEFDDLSELGAAIEDAEWVLHAANQDLPCLAEVGLRPARIFDTELAARLLDYPRVGLGPLIEQVLGYSLEKGHSAADWSTRPLPADWLRYAALDVELLIELRAILADELEHAGKLEWAEEEFAAIVVASPSEPRSDPWRRTSGLHRVRDRRQLAAVRAMWLERDKLAQARDISPKRLLPDTAIIEAALAKPKSVRELAGLPVFRGRAQRREAKRWYDAVSSARQLSEDELPDLTKRYDGPPPARAWTSRDPAAADRLAAARAAVAEIAEQHALPVENLLAPETLRRVAWEPPDELSEQTVAAALAERGARSWQVRLAAGAVTTAFTQE